MSKKLAAALVPAEEAHRQRVQSYGAKRKETLRTSRHLAPQERSKAVSEFLRLPVRRHGLRYHRVGVNDLLWAWGIRDAHLIPRWIKKNDDSGSYSRKNYTSKRSVKKMDRPFEHECFIVVLLSQTKETSHRELLRRFRTLCTTELTLAEFQEKMDREECVGKKRQTTPALKLRHHLSRMLTASAHRNCRGELYYHYDEKNFATHVFNGRVYVSPKFMTKTFMKQLLTAKIQSKTNISWIMIFTCVGRPIPEIGFDGKLFLRRVCKPHVAKKDSVNYNLGDRYDVHCSYDGDMHITINREMCAAISDVFRGTIFENWDIKIRYDGAGPHSCKYAEDACVRHGWKNKPRVLMKRQDAQSPLLNYNDACTYSHLVNGKNGTGKSDYNTVAELMAAIDRAWDLMPAELLERVAARMCVTYKALKDNLGGYTVVPHAGLEKAQKAGSLWKWVAEYMDTW